MVRPVPATADAIAHAAEILRGGGLVALPTETVYGLGADATNPVAVARIFEAKGRPRFNPLIVHVAAVADAWQHGVRTETGAALAEAFWPGALTLVLRREGGTPVCPLASAGLDTIALRRPDHPVAEALLKAAGCPVAAPSANPSGRLSPTTANHVVDLMGDRVDLILDCGACHGGLESTIVQAVTDAPVLLRQGLVTRAALEGVCGPVDLPGADADTGTAESASVVAPGMLANHYAPEKPMRLGATDVAPDEALLAFGPDVPAGAAATRNLSPRGDLVEAAATLFAHLHALDRTVAKRIAVMPVPDTGLGAAINDRLARAAAPRR